MRRPETYSPSEKSTDKAPSLTWDAASAEFRQRSAEQDVVPWFTIIKGGTNMHDFLSLL
jgi:hypothetical protein